MKNEVLGKYFGKGADNGGESTTGKLVSEKDSKLLKKTKKITESITMLHKMEAIDSDAALKVVKSRANKAKKGLWFSYLQKVAVILILPLVLFGLWQTVKLDSITQSITQHEIITPPTLRSVFTLPDGTKVWMNGNTSLSYPTMFNGNERIVELTGEAYFQVAPDKSKPFWVKTGSLFIEAVGTEFNCSSYSDCLRQETLLTEGKVNIFTKDNGRRKNLVALKKNELATFDKESKRMTVRKVDPEKYIAWKDGKMIFRNDVLDDVLKHLERWYNIEFIYQADLTKGYALTGSFKGEGITQVLSYIELTTPISFKILKQERNSEERYQKTRITIDEK